MHGSFVFFNNISSLFTDEQQFPNLERHMLKRKSILAKHGLAF